MQIKDMKEKEENRMEGGGETRVQGRLKVQSIWRERERAMKTLKRMT